MQLPQPITVVAAAVLLLATTACTPALDWRDVPAEGTPLLAQLPCKPSIHERSVQLAGQSLTMTMKTCTTDHATWALAWVKGVHPAGVTQALRQWREAAVRNVGASGAPLQAQEVRGATPNPLAGRSRVQGQRPDGSPITQDLVQFVHGTTVFQASVLSSSPDALAVDQFFAALHLRS